MKKVFSIFILTILFINSTSLGLQYLYQEYLCEDTISYLEVAGRKITVCGKVCSLEGLEKPNQQTQNHSRASYNIEIPPLFLTNKTGNQLILYMKTVKHQTFHLDLNDLLVSKKDMKPPQQSSFSI